MPKRLYHTKFYLALSPVAQMVKKSACNAGDRGLIPGSGRSPWRREWHPTSVFFPRKSHGQRNLVGYSPWGCRVGHDWATNTLTLPLIQHRHSSSQWRGHCHRWVTPFLFCTAWQSYVFGTEIGPQSWK